MRDSLITFNYGLGSFKTKSGGRILGKALGGGCVGQPFFEKKWSRFYHMVELRSLNGPPYTNVYACAWQSR